MYRNEREREIMNILTQHDYMSVKQLSSLLFTSESSIRRDLTAMEIKGLVRRTYGGVEIASADSRIIPFATRLHHNIAEKKAMAKKALSYIEDGQILFLDQSSSALFVAHELIDKRKVTIITNNVEILTFLSQSDLQVYSSGGYLSRSNRNCLLGEDAHEIFSKTHADVLFFSAKALSPEGDIYDFTREEIHIRDTMLRNASKKIFLCDSEKYDKYAGYRQCSLRDIDLMISEKNSIGKYSGYFENK